MKATIDVKSRKDRDAIKRAMTDPAVYAFSVVIGHLMDLPTQKARKRVLEFAAESLAEQQEFTL